MVTREELKVESMVQTQHPQLQHLLREIASGNCDKLRLYLENGPPSDWHTYQYDCHGTLLAYAIKSANLDAFDLMLEHLRPYPEKLAPPKKTVESILWAAIEMYKENSQVLKHVLEHQVFEPVLEKHAFARMADADGRCALHLAAQVDATTVFVSVSNHIRKSRKLMSSEAHNRVPRRAAFSDQHRIRLPLPKEEEMCKVRSPTDGQTPLHLAANRGNRKTLVFLSGCCISPPVDKFGDTILHKAVCSATPDKEMVRFIMRRYPAMVKTLNTVGISPVRVLLEKKAGKIQLEDLQIKDDSLQTKIFKYDRTLEELLMEDTFQRCKTLEDVRKSLNMGKYFRFDPFVSNSY